MTTPSTDNELQNQRTVRELSGEIWAEITMRMPEEDLHWQTADKLVQLIIGVLARHVGKVIVNDEGLEVEPLPRLYKGPEESADME